MSSPESRFTSARFRARAWSVSLLFPFLVSPQASQASQNSGFRKRGSTGREAASSFPSLPCPSVLFCSVPCSTGVSFDAGTCRDVPGESPSDAEIQLIPGFCSASKAAANIFSGNPVMRDKSSAVRGPDEFWRVPRSGILLATWTIRTQAAKTSAAFFSAATLRNGAESCRFGNGVHDRDLIFRLSEFSKHRSQSFIL